MTANGRFRRGLEIEPASFKTLPVPARRNVAFKVVGRDRLIISCSFGLFTSALPPIATEQRTSHNVSNVPYPDVRLVASGRSRSIATTA